MATGNTTLQLTADPSVPGPGNGPVAGDLYRQYPDQRPDAGVVADSFGPRYGLGLGAIARLAAAIIGTLAIRRVPPADRLCAAPPRARLAAVFGGRWSPLRNRGTGEGVKITRLG
jgi:hypothetical protein